MGRAAWALGAVCVGYAVAGVTLVPAGLPLGWDEAVYVGQYDPHRPAPFFSAPRARGVSVLAAPVVTVTASVVALRCFLAAAGALAMFAGFLPWLWVLPRPWAVPLAAFGYATLWPALFYAGAAMPNTYAAMACAAATGWFLDAARRPGARSPLWALAVALAVAGLMRPGEAFWLTAPLAAAVLLVPRWRRTGLAAAVVAGAFVGVLPWMVEAWTGGHGGLAARIARTGEIQGGAGPTFALPLAASALDGPLLCRPCTDGVRWPAVLWWLVLPLFVAAGVRTAVRARRAAAGWLPLTVGVCLAVTYVFFIGYAAPRFLLPSYALLFLPAALGVVGMVEAARPRWRPVIVAVIAVGLLAHLVIQGVILRHWVGVHGEVRRDQGAVIAELDRLGVDPPCVLTGTEAIPIAYRAGCASAAVGGHNGTHTLEGLLALSCRTPTALLTRGGGPAPQWAEGWNVYPVAGEAGPWAIHVPPWTPEAGRDGVPCPIG
ncbi:hypothetical protein GCM10027294_31480 [Marinactinospora endophytica]